MSVNKDPASTIHGNIVSHVYPEGYKNPWALTMERCLIYVCITILLGMLIGLL